MNASFIMVSTGLDGHPALAQSVFRAIKRFSPNPFPSYTTIAKIAGCSRMSVWRWIKYLIKESLLIKIKRLRGQSNIYRIPEHLLTANEAKAQLKGKWEKTKTFFSGPKKVVPPRYSEEKKAEHKVVPPRYSNYIQSYQEGDFNPSKGKEDGPFLTYQEALKTNPELKALMSGIFR